LELFIYHSEECDPKKCTGLRLGRMDKAKILHERREIPRSSVLLEPFASKALSPKDCEIARKNGITALDCSWNRIDQIHDFKENLVPRGLPYLVAANPYILRPSNKLSTLEALTAALYILGEKDQARELLEGFKWGPTFLELNEDPLEAYSQAENSTDIVEIQKDFMPKESL